MPTTATKKRRTSIALILLMSTLLTGCVNPRNPDGALYKLIVPPITWLIEQIAGVFSGNYGLAIILVVTLVRLILMPFMLRSQKASVRQTVVMEKFKPQLDALQARMKEAEGDREAQLAIQQQQFQLFQQVGLNPGATLSSGCLPLLIQFPIITGLYAAVLNNANISSYVFLGIPLGERSILLGVFIIIVYAAQSLISLRSIPKAQRKTALGPLLIMPLLALSFMFTSPAGLMLYFLTSAILSVFQILWTNEIYRPRLKKQAEQELAEHPVHVDIPRVQKTRKDVTHSVLSEQNERARRLNQQKRNKK